MLGNKDWGSQVIRRDVPEARCVVCEDFFPLSELVLVSEPFGGVYVCDECWTEASAGSQEKDQVHHEHF
jgi:hypothetical protein